jgi:DNA-binding NarL/FixJ family response regulator
MEHPALLLPSPPVTGAPIRVVIADDHELLRQGLQAMLRKHSAVTIVGQARNGSELLHLVSELLPDVVITDIQMPVMDGIEATRRIKARWPNIGVIALTMFNEESLVLEMVEANANGYLLKNASGKEIVNAICNVHAGNSYFCSATSARLVSLATSRRTEPSREKTKPAFSPKELRIMHLICEEWQNKEIAADLNMSVRTIESHRERIFEKTGAKNIAGLAIYAVRHGYFSL